MAAYCLSTRISDEEWLPNYEAKSTMTVMNESN